MRHSILCLLRVTAFFIVSGILLLPGKTYVYAGSETIENQVAGILFEESATGKIKVAVLDFSISSVDAATKLSEKELKDRGARYTEEFIANLMNKIKNMGKREKISIIDRSRLDEILREKNPPITGASERTMTEVGRIAGLDVIITGRIQVAGNTVTAIAKVVRVKDGEILRIAKNDTQEKPSIAHAPTIIIDTVEKMKIGSYKALPLKLTSGGTLSVTIEVVQGNPIDINVIPGTELENFKAHKEFKNVADFIATKKKSYKRSANLENGDYFLVLRDSSLGLFSVETSEIKITVQLEQ